MVVAKITFKLGQIHRSYRTHELDHNNKKNAFEREYVMFCTSRGWFLFPEHARFGAHCRKRIYTLCGI